MFQVSSLRGAGSQGSILSQLRSVPHSSLNSLAAKLHWTRLRQASSVGSVPSSACLISALAKTEIKPTHGMEQDLVLNLWTSWK